MPPMVVTGSKMLILALILFTLCSCARTREYGSNVFEDTKRAMAAKIALSGDNEYPIFKYMDTDDHYQVLTNIGLNTPGKVSVWTNAISSANFIQTTGKFYNPAHEETTNPNNSYKAKNAICTDLVLSVEINGFTNTEEMTACEGSMGYVYR